MKDLVEYSPVRVGGNMSCLEYGIIGSKHMGSHEKMSEGIARGVDCGAM